MIFLTWPWILLVPPTAVGLGLLVAMFVNLMLYPTI